MVALAILGVALVAVFQLFSMTLRTARKADDYTKAVFYARSLLDEAYSLPDVEKNTTAVSFEGDFKGKRTVDIEATSEDERVKTYRITVTVTWPPRGSLTMKGLRTVYSNE
jgi:type II secretory pathway pseudopilin PulG